MRLKTLLSLKYEFAFFKKYGLKVNIYKFKSTILKYKFKIKF